MTTAATRALPVSRWWSSAQAYQLAGILMLGAVLRLYRMGGWNANEAFLFVASSRPLRATWEFIAENDPFHPPLFPMLLRLWRILGEGEAFLRLLPIMFGMLSIILIYRLARYLLNERIALLGALLVAVSPFHIFHSQEIRMYSLAFFLSLVALDALARILHAGRPRHWLAYGVAATLSLYADYGGFAMLAGHNLAVVGMIAQRRGPRLLAWVTVQAAVIAAFLPWWPMLFAILAGHGPVVTIEPVPAPAHVPAPAALQNVAFILAAFTSAYLPGGQPWLKAAVVAAAGGVALLGAWTLRRSAPVLTLLSAVIVGPIMAGIGLGVEIGPLRARTVISASAGFYLLLAAGIAALRPRAAAAVLAALLGVNLFSLHLLYHRNPDKVTPWASIAASLATQLQRGDGVVFVDGKWRWVFDRYYPEPRGLQAMGYLGAGDFHRLRAFIDHRRRLYLVLRNEADVDPSGRVRQYVRQRFTQTHRASFPGPLVVERYVRKGGAPP